MKDDNDTHGILTAATPVPTSVPIVVVSALSYKQYTFLKICCLYSSYGAYIHYLNIGSNVDNLVEMRIELNCVDAGCFFTGTRMHLNVFSLLVEPILHVFNKPQCLADP